MINDDALRLEADEAVELAHVLAFRLASDHGIRAMVIKGPVARHFGLRPAGDTSIDVDIWVDPREFETYCGLLRSIGWTIGVLHRSASIMAIHSDAFVHPTWPCEIDVHHRFPGFLADPQLVFDTLWDRAGAISVAGGQFIAAPDRSGSLLVESLHLLRDGPGGKPRLVGLVERVAPTLTENDMVELAQLAHAVGAAEALEPVFSEWGVAAYIPPDPEPEHVESIADWRLRTSVGDALAVPALVELKRSRWRDRPRLLWRTLWLTEAEIRERQPEVPPGQLPLLLARLRRLAWGARTFRSARAAVQRYRSSGPAPLTVVMDAFWWVGGTQSLQNVERGIIQAWLDRYPEDHLVLVVRRKHRNRIDDVPDRVTLVSTRLWPQAIVAAVVLPLVALRNRANAMLSHNFSPIFGRGRVVLIHDLMFETNPEWFTRKELLYYRLMPVLARRANCVLATSETEAGRIRSVMPRIQVEAVGMGISPTLLDPHATEVAIDGVESGRFILTVGRLNIRKNLETAASAAVISGRLTPSRPLLIVGERDGAWTDLPDDISAAVESGLIRFTGFVTEEELRWLLRHCALFVCMSRDEGFGLPPIEAVASGAPVVVSDIPVFRETLRGSPRVTFADPDDVAATALAIGRSELRESVELAREYVSERYSWDAVARRVRDVIERYAR